MSVFQLHGYFQFCTLWVNKRKIKQKTLQKEYIALQFKHVTLSHLIYVFLPSLKVIYIGTVIKFMNHVWLTPFLVLARLQHGVTAVREQLHFNSWTKSNSCKQSGNHSVLLFALSPFSEVCHCGAESCQM